MKFKCAQSYGGVETAVHGEVKENDGLPSCHNLLGQSPLVDILIAVENNVWLRFLSVYERVDLVVNEGIQLHRPMVTWRILDLLISIEQLDVTISEIILPKQYRADVMGLSRDPPMIVLDAKFGLWLSIVGSLDGLGCSS